MRGDRPYTDPVDRKAYLFTPHARGSTPKDDFLRVFLIVYPACAGIDLVPGQVSERLHRLPRMRGDRPFCLVKHSRHVVFTPHARGSTHRLHHALGRPRVYPACAGIDLVTSTSGVFFFCLPRMRGDRPVLSDLFALQEGFTPHARGSTVNVEDIWSVEFVYPACAGIDPLKDSSCFASSGLPRMRGDRPLLYSLRSNLPTFTPHARGSTLIQDIQSVEEGVYPACAGIDLSFRKSICAWSGLPRMRGDRPSLSMSQLS